MSSAFAFGVLVLYFSISVLIYYNLILRYFMYFIVFALFDMFIITFLLRYLIYFIYIAFAFGVLFCLHLLLFSVMMLIS